MVVATIMAFGAGVLISALAFDLVAEATRAGSFWTSMAGFLGGAVVYVGLDLLLDRLGARSKHGTAGSGESGTGLGIALGALLDGIPETAVQGVGLAASGSLSVAVVAAVIISNLPEGLSSTADMESNGRGARYVFGVWIAFGLLVGVAADAFIVRMMLMPALLSLLGKAAWRMPKWLDRIVPDIDVEGHALDHQEQPESSRRLEPVGIS